MTNENTPAQPLTQRYKLTIEYDGTHYVGWQRQNNGPSIQQSIEEAVIKYTQTESLVYGSGRTDAGVHALGQVAHVDLVRHDAANKVRDALNAHLRPQPIAILRVDKVSHDFHARFSARERSYVYRICTRKAPLALDQGKCWWHPRQLDADAMHDAAQVLVGRHDFSTFRAVQCQADSPIRTLDAISVVRHGDEVRLYCRARSFLHHQVRNFVGSLSFVGTGRWTAADLQAALAAKDRQAGGPTAPACGLYFDAISFDPAVDVLPS
jgi:tRNA pseudouridine38-40 synthase